jgi:hypothetical protein
MNGRNLTNSFLYDLVKRYSIRWEVILYRNGKSRIVKVAFNMIDCVAQVDPDAPSAPNKTEAQYIHLLGPNYVSQNLTNGTLSILNNQSAPILAFDGPNPPNGTIPHRHVPLFCKVFY